MDAARLLPVLGLFLMLMPLLWQSDGGARSLGGQLVYLFGLWALLILAAYLLSGRLSRADDDLNSASKPAPTEFNHEAPDDQL